MLKIFTLKYEEKSESFNDLSMSNFLADKELLRWKSHFFERKNEFFWKNFRSAGRDKKWLKSFNCSSNGQSS
jgi:hypothetical protein